MSVEDAAKELGEILPADRLGEEFLASRLSATGSLAGGNNPTFPIWVNIPLSKSSAFFKPLSICETLAVGMAIITP